MSSGKNRPPNNSYSSASNAYDQNAQVHTPDGRELEARVLLKAVKQMQSLQDKWDTMKLEELEETLRYNRNIWMMFTDTATQESNGHSRDVRSNIFNLGTFVIKHSLDIMMQPAKEKLNILIKINREIAAGLMTKQTVAQGGTTTTAGESTPPPADGKPSTSQKISV